MIKKIEKSFNKQMFMKTIGAYLGKTSSGYCEIILPVTNNIFQQHGLVHGGILSTLADNSSAFAAFSLMKEPFQPLTIEFKINFLNIANGEKIISEAVILNYGKTIFHGESKVFSIKGDKKKLAATALVTIKATRRVKEIFT